MKYTYVYFKKGINVLKVIFIRIYRYMEIKMPHIALDKILCEAQKLSNDIIEYKTPYSNSYPHVFPFSVAGIPFFIHDGAGSPLR